MIGNDRIRVLHIIQNLNYGGMERLLAEIVCGVRADRFDSQVMALQYLGRFADGLEKVATLHQAAPMTRFSMLRPEVLSRQIRAIRPDVVHTHSGVWYKATLAARMAGVPWVIHTEHGRQLPDPWQNRFVDNLAARRTDVAVAVSDSVCRLLQNNVVRGSCRVDVVVNGVDTERFQPMPDTGRLRNELGIGSHVPILGSIGRLESIKGFDVMIEAFKVLRTTNSTAVLVLAGDGAQRPLLQQQISRFGLSDSVFLLGWRDDVHDLLSAFSVFTMSSRSEGTSVSLLEAMSSGLCPVVTDVGGNSEVLGAKLAHRLVPSESPNQLARAWRNALTDHEQRKRDAAVARERVEATFAKRNMVAAYERLYQADSQHVATTRRKPGARIPPKTQVIGRRQRLQ
jgi:glycosyltransferase involved in cell wall biosynthesis